MKKLYSLFQNNINLTPFKMNKRASLSACLLALSSLRTHVETLPSDSEITSDEIKPISTTHSEELVDSVAEDIGRTPLKAEKNPYGKEAIISTWIDCFNQKSEGIGLPYVQVQCAETDTQPSWGECRRIYERTGEEMPYGGDQFYAGPRYANDGTLLGFAFIVAPMDTSFCVPYDDGCIISQESADFIQYEARSWDELIARDLQGNSRWRATKMSQSLVKVFMHKDETDAATALRFLANSVSGIHPIDQLCKQMVVRMRSGILIEDQQIHTLEQALEILSDALLEIDFRPTEEKSRWKDGDHGWHYSADFEDSWGEQLNCQLTAPSYYIPRITIHCKSTDSPENDSECQHSGALANLTQDEVIDLLRDCQIY